MDSLTSLLERHDLMKFREKFILAGVKSPKDIARIDKTTLRSEFFMLPADINNFEILRSECIITCQGIQPATSITHLPDRPGEEIDFANLSSIGLTASYDTSPVNARTLIPKYKFDEQSNYKGLGLILVTEKFCDGEVRKGASLDSKSFHSLFTKMKLHIIPIPNATRLDYLTNVKQAIYTNMELSSFFIAISSHGKEGAKIECEDKKFVTVTEIIAMLQIPELINKPKVLLIEACRGKLRDEIETDSTTENFPTYPAATKQSDILVAYSSVPGYVAYRDTIKGSWFVNTLLDAYETVGNEDFVRILTYTNSIMLERNFQDGIQISKQPMHVESTLSKLLFI